jgi:hypothetical protein
MFGSSLSRIHRLRLLEPFSTEVLAWSAGCKAASAVMTSRKSQEVKAGGELANERSEFRPKASTSIAQLD